MKISRQHESNPVYDIINAFKLIHKSHSSNSADELTYTHKILQLCRGIFRSDSTGQIFLYLRKNGAASAWILQIQLDLTEATTYHALRQLRAIGIIEPVIHLPKRRKIRNGGPLPKIWGLIGSWTNEDMAAAINLHYRTLSPKYRLAQEVAQSILDDYIRRRDTTEITYREIRARARTGRARSTRHGAY